MLKIALFRENHTNYQERQSGLKSGGAQRGGEFRGIFTPKNLLIYILSGRGRKSGGARALLAPPRMAPLDISEMLQRRHSNSNWPTRI